MLARNSLIKKTNRWVQRGHGMKWVEIISLRSPGKIDSRFIDELLKGVSECDSQTDTPSHLVNIKVYHHTAVENDLTIHIYWKSEMGSQDKSPLGLRFSSALKPLGLLNHSVWVETAAWNSLGRENDRSRDTLRSGMKEDLRERSKV
jgi:hypothetical protein